MTGDEGAGDARSQELATRLRAVEERLTRACEAVGRTRSDVQLVVVTKFFPASDISGLLALGVTDVGENRDQEASAKAEELGLMDGADSPRMHFVGQLQTNKASSVAKYAYMVQSVDRPKLVRALDRAVLSQGRMLDVLLQVDLRPGEETEAAPGRGGVAPAQLWGLAEGAQEAEGLRLRGLMSVAPLGEDPVSAFGRLAELRERFIADFPQADLLSAGMSADLEAGIAVGATHVRVGSAILGLRPQAG